MDLVGLTAEFVIIKPNRTPPAHPRTPRLWTQHLSNPEGSMFHLPGIHRRQMWKQLLREAGTNQSSVGTGGRSHAGLGLLVSCIRSNPRVQTSITANPKMEVQQETAPPGGLPSTNILVSPKKNPTLI